MVPQFAIGISAAQTGAPSPCAPGMVGHEQQWCNPSLSFEARAADLVSRIPAADKPKLLDTTDTTGVPSLGIPGYQWWSE